MDAGDYNHDRTNSKNIENAISRLRTMKGLGITVLFL